MVQFQQDLYGGKCKIEIFVMTFYDATYRLLYLDLLDFVHKIKVRFKFNTVLKNCICLSILNTRGNLCCCTTHVNMVSILVFPYMPYYFLSQKLIGAFIFLSTFLFELFIAIVQSMQFAFHSIDRSPPELVYLIESRCCVLH